MKRILVTGVNGFIGSFFVKMLLIETNWQIVGFGRNSSSCNKARLSEVSNQRFQSIDGDFCDSSAISGLCEGIDYVVNFAARTFVDHSILDPKPFIDSNVGGTFNLLEQARKYKVKRYLQVSTDEVYGAILNGSYDEKAPLNPSNPYSATKAAGDMLVLSYFNTYGLSTTVTRMENVYGPWQHRQKAIPVFVRKALEGEKIPVYGDGLHSRQWLHIDDACSGIFKALQDGGGGEVYHIAGSQELKNIELAQSILRILDKSEDQYELIDDHNLRPGHDRRYALDSSKLRTLGWSPKYDLASGLAEVVGWYRDNIGWLQS